MDGAAEGTKSALREFLKASRRPEELKELLEQLGEPYKHLSDCLEEEKEEKVMALDFCESSPLAELYRLLLGSFWLAPAFELAFGLQGRPEARSLWKAR